MSDTGPVVSSASQLSSVTNLKEVMTISPVQTGTVSPRKGPASPLVLDPESLPLATVFSLG